MAEATIIKHVDERIVVCAYGATSAECVDSIATTGPTSFVEPVVDLFYFFSHAQQAATSPPSRRNGACSEEEAIKSPLATVLVDTATDRQQPRLIVSAYAISFNGFYCFTQQQSRYVTCLSATTRRRRAYKATQQPSFDAVNGKYATCAAANDCTGASSFRTASDLTSRQLRRRMARSTTARAASTETASRSTR